LAPGSPHALWRKLAKGAKGAKVMPGARGAWYEYEYEDEYEDE
jgi:hypothetical protein